MLVAKLSPHGDDLSELFCGRIALHDLCWHDRNVFCDQPRIEAVVLSEHATGAAELAQLVRVDASHRQVRRQQGSDDGALVAATRLDANCSDRQATQSFDQLAVTGGVVIHRKGFPFWQPPSRRDDRSIRRFHRNNALSSSCPCLADAGSCPGNCPGMEEAAGAPSSFAV